MTFRFKKGLRNMSQQTTEGRGLHTAKETAAHLAISKRHLANLMRRRQVPFIRLGRAIRFRLADVEAAIAKLTVRSV